MGSETPSSDNNVTEAIHSCLVYLGQNRSRTNVFEVIYKAVAIWRALYLKENRDVMDNCRQGEFDREKSKILLSD